MKTVHISVLAGLLAVTPSIAAVVPGAVNGVISGSPPPGNQRRTDQPGCNADNVLRALRNPTRSVGASAFCSTFLQPTVTSTQTASTTIVSSILTTTTTTTTTSSTTTSVVPGPTVTCAAGSGATCGLEAYGYGEYLISSQSGLSGLQCHEKCLADPTCKSFQTQAQGSQFCNIFNAYTAGNVQVSSGGGFVFYDRGCPDFLPAECTPTVAPTPKQKRQVQGPTPDYLATVPASRISSACKCFITSPAATYVSLTTLIVPTTTSTTVVSVITSVTVTTTTPVSTATVITSV